MATLAQRHELADFLKKARARLSPKEVGLPEGGRRRSPGLRREEVAQLASISFTWYAWLEQARDVQTSQDVLSSLARALRLSPAERDHLFLLGGSLAPEDQMEEDIDSPLKLLLDHLGSAPAYVTGRRWDILAWNRAAAEVFADFDEVPVRDRNALLLIFTHKYTKPRLIDSSFNASHYVAQFRADATRYAGDPAFEELIDRLLEESPQFREWWPRHEVAGTRQGVIQLDHPTAGLLSFEYATLMTAQAPHLRLQVFTPDPTTATSSNIEALLAAGVMEAP